MTRLRTAAPWGLTLFLAAAALSPRAAAQAHCPEWTPGIFDGSRGLDGEVRALASFDDGSGPALYAGGAFTHAGGVPASHVARYRDGAWSALGDGTNDAVGALLVFDDGTGPALYAGGDFTRAGGVDAAYVARWDGSRWSAVGDGLPTPVLCLAAHDDGAGPSLYAGGNFDSWTGGLPCARWDGAAWRSVGSGLQGTTFSLASFDDGSRRLLVAGGTFSTAVVAYWDGVAWTGPASTCGSGAVRSLAAFDDGSGPALFAGGVFTCIDGGSESGLARWDGGEWTALADGVLGEVKALVSHDDSSGPALYLGGRFETVYGMAASRIARWDGVAFTPLGSGMDNRVSALLSFGDDAAGPSLVAGGAFVRAGDSGSSRVARWFDPCGTCARGTVNAKLGPVTDVLFVNDSAGGSERRVAARPDERLVVFMNAPPAAGAEAAFALYLEVGDVAGSGVFVLPRSVGSTCFATPLSGGSPRVVWNNMGVRALGEPRFPSSPAPSVVVDRLGGARRAVTFVLQGLIGDPGSAAEVPASVTNSVTVEIR